MEKVLEVIDKINLKIGQIVSLCIVLMVCSVTLEILMRAFVGRPLVWTFETSLFLFGGYTMLLGGYAFLCGSHVKMDALYSRFSKRVRTILDLATFPLFFVYVCAILWLGVQWVYSAWQYHETSQTLWAPILLPIKSTIPLGAFLLLLAGIAKFIRDLQRLFCSKEGRVGK